jgi:hypothetical protein
MNAWVVAGVVFVAVLVFEYLMFRYVGGRLGTPVGGDGRTTQGVGDAPTAEAAASDDPTEAPTPGDRAGTDTPEEAGCTFPDCGAANDDGSTVVFCWNCLARLR